METIIVNVPKHWGDERKEEFKDLLQSLISNSDFKHHLILITNKIDTKIISADTMDKLRKL